MDWKKYLAGVARQVMSSVSVDLVVNLRNFAIKFREDARQTENPWDDIVADLICGILGIGEADTE